MESLYNIDLNLEGEYIDMIEHLLKIIFSYIFLLIVEGNIKPDIFSLLSYSVVGNLFYHLVFKKIINFKLYN